MRYVVIALVLLLSACGVRPTGVVPAGDPPMGVARGPLLYFLADGKLRPVTRDTGHLGSLAEALSLLAAGPTLAERAAGLTSEVPAAPLSESGPAQGVVTLQFAGVGRLSAPAMDQLVCTVIGTSARGSVNGRNVLVQFVGPVSVPARGCPVSS
ncbi:hypothetical protein [Amycolatopsis sp.]|uniref:hypothetical protein n=1 Tax=Amycolatopsis sp. TaxID=37632 RepID=UPI002CFFE1C2|nr:hypothetical protein [Amycolatopsis sp.]HVV13085.1 hypothetical protein [Amycolatopsis sp.]